MAQQVTDEWQSVELAFGQLEKLGESRQTLAAMRRLVTMVRADPRFHDLEPSMSHACLVFRRQAKRGVLACWNDDHTYGLAFVEPGFTLRDDRRVSEETVLDALLDYLKRASG